MIKPPINLQERRRRLYRKAKFESAGDGDSVKAVTKFDRTHNPLDEIYRVSCLRENLTSSSKGEGLETGRRSTLNGHAGGKPRIQPRAIEFGKLFWPISALSFGPPDGVNHQVPGEGWWALCSGSCLRLAKVRLKR